MDYQNWIGEKLIEKYEKSKAFVTGSFAQKISLAIQKDGELATKLENVEEKTKFLASLRILKSNEIIEYSWVKYEQGNLVDKVWLLPNEESIRACYTLLNRVPAKDIIIGLVEVVSDYQTQLVEESALYRYLNKEIEVIKEKQKIPRLFSDDLSFMKDILECLVYMEHNEEEVLERILSVKLYGDSKCFEKRVRGKVLSILRDIKKQNNDEVDNDEELLSEKGIVKWPEIIEFTGAINVTLLDESRIEYSGHRFGAYINSKTIKAIKDIELEKVQKVIFIENKANYVWYVENRKMVDEVVIYHGGCYSPIKGKWFQKIYEAGEKSIQTINYYHWSDIDIGGFRIFTRLKNTIIPRLLPYHMDASTLLKYRNRALTIEDKNYEKVLGNMLRDIMYQEFWPVIQEMLRYNIRLEQENLIT